MSNEREIHDADGRRPASQVPRHPDAPYEEKDLHVGPILALLVATACVFATMFAVDWYFFHAQKRSEAQKKKSPYPFATRATSSLPQAPRLDQIDRMEEQPGQRYADQLAEMERQLHASGPADEKGFVHIPIERAMKEIVKQLPLRKGPPAQAFPKEAAPQRPGWQEKPVHPGDSNSGRMLPGTPPWSEY
jgi:hypothetical protein